MGTGASLHSPGRKEIDVSAGPVIKLRLIEKVVKNSYTGNDQMENTVPMNEEIAAIEQAFVELGAGKAMMITRRTP
jgi:hypothetical protein